MRNLTLNIDLNAQHIVVLELIDVTIHNDIVKFLVKCERNLFEINCSGMRYTAIKSQS